MRPKLDAVPGTCHNPFVDLWRSRLDVDMAGSRRRDVAHRQSAPTIYVVSRSYSLVGRSVHYEFGSIGVVLDDGGCFRAPAIQPGLSIDPGALISKE